MRSVISILICMALLVVLLRRKISVGKAMLISGIALGALLGVGPVSFWGQLCEEWTSKPFVQRTGYLFVSLTALVLLVNVIAEAMTFTGVNERLVPAMQAIFRSRRVAISVIPLMLGMLPSPGGIMLSAPMVREMGDRLKIERSRQAAINFYFRHLWEPIWPLFPAIPLIQGILGISARSIVLYNSLVILTGIVGGVIFLLLTGIPPKAKAAPKKPDPFHRHLKNFSHAFWPIAAAVILYAGFNVPPAAGIFVALTGFLILHKVPLKKWGRIYKAGGKGDFVLLILGALIFKINLETANAVGDVMKILEQNNISEMAVIFFVPFLVAVLTGVTSATVAITFPLLAPMIGFGSQAKLPLEVLGISGVICGLFVTPIHLCLALSVGYFETDFLKIITRILPAVLLMAATAWLAALFL